MRARQHILAEQQLAQLEAVSLAVARFFGTDEMTMKKNLQDLAHRAYPDD